MMHHWPGPRAQAVVAVLRDRPWAPEPGASDLPTGPERYQDGRRVRLRGRDRDRGGGASAPPTATENRRGDRAPGRLLAQGAGPCLDSKSGGSGRVDVEHGRQMSPDQVRSLDRRSGSPTRRRRRRMPVRRARSASLGGAQPTSRPGHDLGLMGETHMIFGGEATLDRLPVRPRVVAWDLLLDARFGFRTAVGPLDPAPRTAPRRRRGNTARRAVISQARSPRRRATKAGRAVGHWPVAARPHQRSGFCSA